MSGLRTLDGKDRDTPAATPALERTVLRGALYVSLALGVFVSTAANSAVSNNGLVIAVVSLAGLACSAKR